MKKLLLLPFILIILFNFSYGQITNQVIDFENCGVNIFSTGKMVTERYTDAPGPGFPITLTVSGLPADCYSIKAAYLWSVVSYYPGTHDPMVFNVTNTNNVTNDFTSVKTGESIAKCWSESGTRGYRADITSAISGNGDYVIRSTQDQREVDGVTLFIIYTDNKATYQGRVVIYDGLITLATGDLSEQKMPAINACDNTSNAKAFGIASDIQGNFSPNCLWTLNGTPATFGADFWNSDMVSTTVPAGASTPDYQVKPGGSTDCYSWLMMGLYYQTTTCKVCGNASLNVTASASQTSVCPGMIVQLSSSGAERYSWSSNPPGFNSINQNPDIVATQTTEYTVTGTTADGCLVNTAKVTITVFPQPAAHSGKFFETCLGSPVQIGQEATGGTPPFTYHWEPVAQVSDPNIFNPVVNPNTTSSYYVTVTDANGCIAHDTAMVKVNLLPVLNAGNDTNTCVGTPVQIGANATGGTPPFNYSWSPPTGLNVTNQAIVSANPPDTTQYIITVTDSKGCMTKDSITVNVWHLPKPVITPLGPTTFCSCDSLKLDAGPDYTGYKWSTGGTTRFLTVRNSGNYTVTVTDTNGCVNTSAPIAVTVVQPTTTVELPLDTIGVQTGEHFTVPMRMADTSNLDFCKALHFTAQVSFIKTIMVPTRGTPTGVFVNDRRVITIHGDRSSQDSILTNMSFLATLGDTANSDMHIDSFTWDECPFNVNTVNSNVVLTNLCSQGGVTRLFLSPAVDLIFDIKPNPTSGTVDMKFSNPYGGQTKIIISDLLGRQIGTLFDSDVNAGDYQQSADLSVFMDGTYIIRLQSSGQVVVKLLEVRK